MSLPYEATGRRQQKSRTRDALVEAARRLLADGEALSVERVAATAGISRTTAYRYFPSPDSLVVAAYPEGERTSLLGEGAPTAVEERLDVVLTELFAIVRRWEPQLRAALATSVRPDSSLPVMRQGRAIGWLGDALAPLGETHPRVDRRDLAVRIRSVAGIEPLVWLVDVAGYSRKRAFATMRRNAHAVLADALNPG